MTLNVAMWWWFAHQKPANSESSGQDPENMGALELALVAVLVVIIFLVLVPGKH